MLSILSTLFDFFYSTTIEEACGAESFGSIKYFDGII
jgi:hypothetical protein